MTIDDILKGKIVSSIQTVVFDWQYLTTDAQQDIIEYLTRLDNIYAEKQERPHYTAFIEHLKEQSKGN